MATNAFLQSEIRRLEESSQQLSTKLTQKLASSENGQNLLHIGTSLSSLPPDLHRCLSQMRPLQTVTETLETKQSSSLQELVEQKQQIVLMLQRTQQAQRAKALVQDLLAAERAVAPIETLQDAFRLERTIHIVNFLTSQLEYAKANLHEYVELADCLVQLQPRCRRLRQSLLTHLVTALDFQQSDMCQICLRGLVLLNAKEPAAHQLAASVVVPLLQNHLTVGRIDQGGARGECTGLSDVLDHLYTEIVRYQPLLDSCPSLQLWSLGVWGPFVTRLTDTNLQMSIFAPGMADIFQRNYRILEAFTQRLAQHATVARHPQTAVLQKKWNLPIYYQLRFGSAGARLNTALTSCQRKGWTYSVYTGEVSYADMGLELSVFWEIYETLGLAWQPHVFLGPLTNRFLRGTVQLLGRVLAFLEESMEGKILFGPEPVVESEANGETSNGSASNGLDLPTKQYCWGDSAEEVAAVAWELTILESTLRHDYLDHILQIVPSNEELADLIRQVLYEALEPVRPLIEKGWNEKIVPLLTAKCATPLAAVKGVAATYRMTNRPPPTQASPFVSTILRPVSGFSDEFGNRTPEFLGNKWKQTIVVSIADKYATAVEDLLQTVQRTEVALKNRKARRTTGTGMSDGEKVKLQVYLDRVAFERDIQSLGLEPNTIVGISKLRELTQEGEGLLAGTTNGSV